MRTSLDPAHVFEALDALIEPNNTLLAANPGDAIDRQPVHVVYGGAHLFKAHTAARLGELARAHFREHAPTPEALAALMGLAPALAATVHANVAAKLEREPVEDYRIDFEDGYGARPGPEEDRAAIAAAYEVAAGLSAGSLPPFIGIRTKSMADETKRRAIRTLDLFVSALIDRGGGRLPPGFVVTLPKVQLVAHVAVFVELIEALERRNGLPEGAVRLELMIETSHALMAADGTCPLPALVRAGRGRVRGVHFGAYDYTASLGIAAPDQHLHHPACDHARTSMQQALAGTGVFLSDGATTQLPVGGPEAVHAAWRNSFHNITHALQHGYRQGWDLHPAQIPVRYVASHAYYLAGKAAMSERLSKFLENAAQATLVGDQFDDAATGHGLLNWFRHAYNCGAVDGRDLHLAGLSTDDLRTRSFSALLANRRRP